MDKKREMEKKLGGIKGFSIQFLPYSEIRGLNSDERIKKILGIILGNNILVIQGRLSADEETRLIGDTMAMIDHVKSFKGIELAVISGSGREGVFGIFYKRNCKCPGRGRFQCNNNYRPCNDCEGNKEKSKEDRAIAQ